MSGVTIISETNTSAPPVVLLILLGISALGVIIATVTIIGALWKCLTIFGRAFIILLVACFVIIDAGLWAGTLTKDNSKNIQYTVTVDDTVNFNDFMSKYEIIKQQGDTYVVRERPTE